MQGSIDTLYEINNLSEANAGAKYSGFGVILDATRAIRVKSKQNVEFSTQIKLIDKSYNPGPGGAPANMKEFVTFFIFWTDEDYQPFPFKIGDIMRFNYFDFEKFRDFLQGKNKKGSSWCIFHGESTNNDPYCQSSDFNEKMTQYHVQRLHELRQWTTQFFQYHSLKTLDWYSYERHQNNPAQFQTFDMLLRVQEIRLPSDASGSLLLTLVDEKLSKYQTHVSAIHGRFLKEGDIVKLRSIEGEERGYLKTNQRYFAVLGIPSTFRDYQEFVNIINVQESQEAKRAGMMEAEDEEQNMAPSLYGGFDFGFFDKGGILLQGGSTLSSAVSLRHKNRPKQTAFEVLKELESQEFDKIVKENNKYHLRLTLIDIKPKSLMQCLRNECKTCRLVRKLDAPEGETCCQRKMERTMLLRLLWQDQSLKPSKKLFITYVAPGEENYTKCIFPEFSLSEIVSGKLEAHEKQWEDILEKYLEDDRLFDILVEPMDNISLKEKDGQVPLRIVETLFVPVMK